MKTPLLFAALIFASVLAGPAPARADDELSLYFITSAWPIDWSSPATAARTGVASNIVIERGSKGDIKLGLNSHSVGHTHIHIHCDATVSNPERDIWTAVTNDHSDGPDSDSTRQHALISGSGGAEQLIRDVSGKYYTPDEIQKDLDYLKHNLGARVGEATWKVTPAQCRRMGDFYDYYNAAQRFKIFGSLAARPICGDGGGCTAYAMSFAEEAGLLDDSIVRATQVCVRIKKKFLNYPGHDADRGMLNVLFFGGEWAKPSEPGYDLCFLDPSRARDWVYSIFGSSSINDVGSSPVLYKTLDGDAAHIVIDGRREKPMAAGLLRDCGPRLSDLLVPENAVLRNGYPANPGDRTGPATDPLAPRELPWQYNEVPTKQPPLPAALAKRK